MLTALIALTTTSVVTPVEFDKYPHYSVEKFRFAVTYQPGGRTKMQAWRKVDDFTPLESVVFVCNGGYFAPNVKPIVAIDYVLTKGVEVVGYRRDWQRPILSFGENEVKIFSSDTQKSAIAKLEEYRQNFRCLDAIAGDSLPVYPNNKHDRRLVGIRGKEVVFITLKKSTVTDCQREVRRQRLDDFIYLDGGTSISPYRPVPTHLVVLADKISGG